MGKFSCYNLISSKKKKYLKFKKKVSGVCDLKSEFNTVPITVPAQDIWLVATFSFLLSKRWLIVGNICPCHLLPIFLHKKTEISLAKHVL